MWSNICKNSRLNEESFLTESSSTNGYTRTLAHARIDVKDTLELLFADYCS